MLTRPLTCTALASLSLAAAAAGQTVTLEKLRWANTTMDLSPDGRFLVGLADQNEDGFADGVYRYDFQTEAMTILAGGNNASGVSDDGTVVVGDMPDPGDGVEVAGMWTLATGWQSLGWLPDALNCPSRSNGYEVSADGTVVTGLSWDGCSGRAFVWTQATGMLELQALANGGNRGTVISADGTVIGGFAQGSSNRTPAMWDGVTLLGALLDPPNGDIIGEVVGISDDGTILLGNWGGDAFKWTSEGGVEVIGAGSTIPSWNGWAMDIADNGTIVGFDSFFQNRRAWIKPAGETELVVLSDYILDHGGQIPSGLTLDICMRISADGLTIVGHSFFQHGWKIIIGPGCPGDIVPDDMVGVQDFLALLAAWGPNPGHPADINEDDVVDVVDFLDLLANWGPCP